jgi:hypothetical protein
MCDGFFIPNVYLTGGDAACAAQCPDAPTALYMRPAGSDDIGSAISLRGTPYSTLPVANREQTTYDETCTCHRGGKHSYVAELMHDQTLRPGDMVVTESLGLRLASTALNGNRPSAWSACRPVAACQRRIATSTSCGSRSTQRARRPSLCAAMIVTPALQNGSRMTSLRRVQSLIASATSVIGTSRARARSGSGKLGGSDVAPG